MMIRVQALAAALFFICPLSASQPTKGSQAYAEGKAFEEKREWDAALERFQKALDEDPANLVFQIAVYRARFLAGQAHREEAARATVSAAEKSRQEARARFTRLQSVPQLAPLNSEPIDLKLVNQSPKAMFESVCKYTGINLVIDPDYLPGKNLSLDVRSATIGQALDFLATATRSFWKPLSANTILLTNDLPAKRHDFEDLVTRTFYLSNLNTPAELQEVVTTIRTIAELPRIVASNNQYAIVARGEPDRILLAEKIVSDLDKPRSEVLVDIYVLEAGSTFSRQLSTALASTGLNVPVNFTPRSRIQVSTGSSSSSSSSTSVSLAGLSHLASADFSTSLPGALLQAALSDATTKVMQAPQVRAVDNAKAVLKIGEREPVASGSFSAAAATTTGLVNTQFTYIDVGVNVEMTPRVHDTGEVSLHIELEISSVTGQVNFSGINQPVIGQRKVIHDVRVREGEVSLLGGLINENDSQTVTGIPGLANIPFLRRFFTGNSRDRSHSELMIAMVPHIVRRPDISVENLRSIGTGTAAAVKLTESPKAAVTAPNRF